MTDISTGTLVTSGSTTYIVGTSSGINTSALVDIAVSEVTAEADLIDVQIDENSAKVTAYSELESLVSAVQTSLGALSSSTSILDDSSSTFDLRSGTLSSSGTADPTSLISVGLDSDAETGTYDIEVTQRAESHLIASGALADSDAALGYAGDFDIGLNGGASSTIAVTAGMSLNDIADLINAEVGTTNVSASVLQVSETSYRLTLSATNTNQDIEITPNAGDDIMTLLDVSDGLGGFDNELQAAQGAIIEFDGLTVTRDDNSFDDLLAGVDLDIVSAAPGTTITLDIGYDTSSAKSAIEDFISAYNELRSFILQNQEVSADGVISDDAILFSELLLDEISAIITSIVGDDFSSGSTLATILDLGIDFDSNNYLSITDETALDEALLNNFSEVQSFFQSGVTSDNSEFALINNENTNASQDIVFNISYSGGAITGVTANGDNSAFTVSGTRLIGAEGSAYEGLTFSYQGTSSVTINSSLTQGLANLLTTNLEDYTNSSDGLIVQERLSLLDTNEDLSAEAVEIRNEAEEVRTREIQRYAAMEAQIESLKILQSQIRAILGIDTDD